MPCLSDEHYNMLVEIIKMSPTYPEDKKNELMNTIVGLYSASKKRREQQDAQKV